jgi:hypothetical protein
MIHRPAFTRAALSVGALIALACSAPESGDVDDDLPEYEGTFNPGAGGSSATPNPAGSNGGTGQAPVNPGPGSNEQPPGSLPVASNGGSGNVAPGNGAAGNGAAGSANPGAAGTGGTNGAAG